MAGGTAPQFEWWMLHALVVLFAGTWMCFAPPRTPRRLFAYVGVGVVAYFVLFYTGRSALAVGELWRASTFIGTLFLTAGWIVTNEVSIHNSRKQHTIAMVTDYLTNPQLVRDQATIHQFLPSAATKFTPAIADFKAQNHPLCVAIDRRLNFFEFLALGLFLDDLDEQIASEAFRGVVLSFYRQMEDYIEYWQGDDEETWEHLRWLYRRWSRRGSFHTPPV